MSKKILIVDDEVDFVGVLLSKLERDGYEAVVAHTGRDGLIQARAHLPDIILMDIVLPDMDGPEVIKELHDTPATSGIPVIFLSGIVSDDHGGNRSVINVGGRPYEALGKPFTYQDIKNRIDRILSMVG